MNLKDKEVMVYGTGVSGIAAAKLLLRHGAHVILFDQNTDLNTEKVLDQFEKDAVELILGNVAKERQEKLSFLVLSPGVPVDGEIVTEIKKQGIPVWGEIELAYRCQKGSLLAITGTNGKTTTTSLLGEIMSSYNPKTKVVGNIGIPYTGIADDTVEDSVVVAEISSFQLETIETFHPKISAILNITPDHLNRHHTMRNYIDAKISITKNQTEHDICILNYEDEILREEAKHIKANIIWFSSARKIENGICCLDDEIFYKGEKVISVRELNILGRHNYENAMAAIAMAAVFGVPMEQIVTVLRQFQAVEHRIEYVTEKRGVRFYNDSKGTNPDAAIKGIQAMDRPTYLIAGGYDKQSDYMEWIQSFDGKVKKLVLLGQTKEAIAETAKRCGFHDYIFVESLQEAVSVCYHEAITGDCVLLSPACASWGMFPNYEVRGRMFKDFVHALKE